MKSKLFKCALIIVLTPCLIAPLTLCSLRQGKKTIDLRPPVTDALYNQSKSAYENYLNKHRSLPSNLDFLPQNLRKAVNNSKHGLQYASQDQHLYYLQKGNCVVFSIGYLNAPSTAEEATVLHQPLEYTMTGYKIDEEARRIILSLRVRNLSDRELSYECISSTGQEGILPFDFTCEHPSFQVRNSSTSSVLFFTLNLKAKASLSYELAFPIDGAETGTYRCSITPSFNTERSFEPAFFDVKIEKAIKYIPFSKAVH